MPINTAYKGTYLTHQLTDSGAGVLVVSASYFDRVAAIAQDIPTLEHVIIVDDADADKGAKGRGARGLSATSGSELTRSGLCAPLGRNHGGSIEPIRCQRGTV